MKKTSIIAIALIYLVAVILVGFLGIKLKVYNEVIYAEKIMWDSNELEKQSGFKVEKNKDVLLSQGLKTDASLKYVVLGFSEDITINIKCYCIPENATNTKLDYYFDDVGDHVDLKIKDDNTADIIFSSSAGFTLYVKTTDGKDTSYSIRIDIIDMLE